MHVKVENGVGRIYTRAMLKIDNPNTGFPPRPSNELLAAYDIFPLIQTAAPAYNEATENLVRGEPVFRDPRWEVDLVVTAKSPEEIAEYTKETERSEDIALLKADPQVLALLKKRPDQINAYVENQITDLASAKTLLKVLSRAVSVLAHTTVN